MGDARKQVIGRKYRLSDPSQEGGGVKEDGRKALTKGLIARCGAVGHPSIMLRESHVFAEPRRTLTASRRRLPARVIR